MKPITLRWLGLLALTALSQPVLAEPRVSSTEGPARTGERMTIRGSGFGKKNPAAPLITADFEHGIQPSRLGRRRKWDGVDHLSWADCGVDASKGLEGEPGAGSWRLRVDYDYWTQAGQPFFVRRRTRMNFVVTNESQNWKFWRMWPENDSNMPNVYAAPTNGRVFVEGVGRESGFWARFPCSTVGWVTEELIGRASSGMDVKDGSLIIRRDGVELGRGTLMTRSQQAPDYMRRNYVVHGVAHNKGSWNPSWSSSNRFWVDDVYVDTTWSRVVIGDAPLYEKVRADEIQIPLAWSDAEITVQADARAFSDGQIAYLYVFDAAGQVNREGFPLKIGRPDETPGPLCKLEFNQVKRSRQP